MKTLDLMATEFDAVKFYKNKIIAIDGLSAKSEIKSYPDMDDSDSTVYVFYLKKDFIINYNIDNLYGGGVERESFKKAEKYIGHMVGH